MPSGKKIKKKQQNLNRQWFREYQKQGIPSSFRTQPSGAVLFLNDFLKKHRRQQGGRLLDLGSGQGRNSFYSARQGFQVDSIEIVTQLVTQQSLYAQKHHLDLKAHPQSITDPLPFPAKTFDVIIDIFAYKHQTNKAKQKAYRQEIRRTLKDDGIYLLSLAGDDDGYYGPLLQSSPDPKNKMIIDPANQIASLLYSKNDVIKEFKSFKVVKFLHKQKVGLMHGKKYPRSTLVFIMRKKNL